MIGGWSLVSAEEQQEDKLIIRNIEGGFGFNVTIFNPGDEAITDISLDCDDVDCRIEIFPQKHFCISSIGSHEVIEKDILVFDVGPGELITPIEVVFTLSYGETTIERTVYCGIYGPCVYIAGTFYNDGGSHEGYTLYTPWSSTASYLINNDGEIVHKWNSGLFHLLGMGAYLTEDGELIRSEYDGICELGKWNYNAGGMTGRVAKYDWDGECIWKFPYYSETYCLHHDIAVLPNGNILMTAWENKTKDEAIAAGLNTDNWDDTMLIDKIIEVNPTIWDPIEKNYDEAIVWEWHAWDHLIQNYDPTKDNYNVVEDHPELIDINLIQYQDFLHTNSMEYIEEFNQILLSLRHINEIVVIDHTTTTQQAAGHEGGEYGQGGDLLYRWGNSSNYGRAGDQQLFLQHDARVIESGCPGEGHFTVFNNQNPDDVGKFSTVIEIDPPVDEDGFYYLEEDCAFGPSEPDWIWGDEYNKDRFYVNDMGGAQRLPNGNTLICDAPNGRIFEVNQEDEVIWQYTNLDPTWMDFDSILVNDVFKMQRYPLDYPGIGELESEPVSYITEMEYLMTPNPSYDPLLIVSDIYVSPSSYLQSSQQTVNFYDMSESYYDNITSWVWDFGDGNYSYTQNTSHIYAADGVYTVTLNVTDNSTNSTLYSVSSQLVYIDSVQPEIASVTNTPDIVGFGSDVTINASVFDNLSGIDTVWVNVTYPDDSYSNSTMGLANGSYYEYVFDDTWLTGQYNYTIWVYDKSNNNISSSGHSFNISTQATMSVCTIKDEYGNNETVNLTDPPGSNGFIGYEFLDNGSVLLVWNRFDNYYFNTSNGIQFSNHYNQYWSHNVLMLGYYNNEVWNLVYRVDELSGFNKNIVSDNETFVNVTLWKDLSYSGYDFRLAIRYFLGVDDNELVVIPYIKNLGVEIPFVLGFAWELKDIQVDMTTSGDYIEINGTSFYLNQSLDETYEDLTDPCFYIREDISNYSSESLYLRWDENLDYKFRVKSRDGQYNAPVTLGIKIGTLGVGQEKYTSLFWHDASSVVFYFNSYDSGFPGEFWLTNPGYMVDGNESTFASTNINDDVELLVNNSCNKSSYGTIVKVELRCKGYRSGFGGGSKNIVLRPVFVGGDGNNHSFSAGTVAAWSSWFNITGDMNAPGAWSWTDVDFLDVDVESDLSSGYTLYCSKVEVRVTYNNAPVISNPYPSYGETGVGLCPLLNITVSDNNGDLMNITWYYWGSSGWVVFGTHHNVGNGTFSKQFDQACVNGQWWSWKVSVDDGIANVSSAAFIFYTGNKSEIANNGVTNFSGYLLMQIQYYDSGDWVLDYEVINESSTRTIAIGGQLGLDTIFNDLISTDDLSNGNGLYHVYAAFRDPNGNILIGDDEAELVAMYEFTVTFE